MPHKTAMLMTVGISLLENVADRIHNKPSVRQQAQKKWDPLPSKAQIMSGQGIEQYYAVAYPNFQQEL